MDKTMGYFDVLPSSSSKTMFIIECVLVLTLQFYLLSPVGVEGIVEVEKTPQCAKPYPDRFNLSVVVGFYVSPTASPTFDEKLVRHRVQVMLDCLSYLFSHDSNLRAEVIVVHWNSTFSLLEKWVTQFNRSNLPWVRLVEVSTEAVARYQVPCITTSSLKSPTCQEYIAKNVGARQARGDWVLFLNLDVILPKELIAFLKKKPNSNTLYLAEKRINLPEPILLDKPYKMYAEATRISLKSESSCTHCRGDFMLLSRGLLWKARAYAEIGLEYHIEYTFQTRIKAVGGTVKSSSLVLMHQYHIRTKKQSSASSTGS